MSARPPWATPWLLLLTLWLDVLAIGLIVPVLPDLLARVSDGGLQQAWLFGLMQLAFALPQMLCAPLWGALSDRRGRRPVLLGGLLATAISFIVLAWSESVGALLLARFLCGVASANAGVIYACMADISPHDQRVHRYGQLGAAYGLAFVIGPGIGGMLSQMGINTVLWAAAFIVSINALLAGWLLPETLQVTKGQQPHNWAPWQTALDMLRSPATRPALVLIASVACVQAGLEAFWMLYTGHRFHWDAMDNGVSLSILGLMGGLAQLVLMPRIQKSMSPDAIITRGLLSFSFTLLMWSIAPAGWLLIALMPLNLLGYMIYPCAQAILVNRLPDRHRGVGLGALSAINSAAAVTGPALLTPFAALALAHPATQSHLVCGLPFALCALLMLANWIWWPTDLVHPDAHMTDPQ